MTKNNAITEEMLSDLGVYELRELARGIGVSSPTTKKRAELCEQIIKISKGEQKGEQKRTNKGRPPKTVNKMASLVSEFVPEDILNLQKNPDMDSNVLKLAQNPLLNNQYLSEEKQVYGYINSVNNHLYIKNLKIYNEFKDTIFYIPEDLVKKYSLRVGDKIFANGRMSEMVYCGIIDEILKINNENPFNYTDRKKRKDLSTFEIPSVKEMLFNSEIKKGERLLCYFNNQEEAIVKILEKFNGNSDTVIILGVELPPEIIYYIKSKNNIESFTTSFYNTLEESYDNIINSIEYSNTLLKDGKSVKFIIFDIMGILSRLDLYYANETNKFLNHNISSIQMLKRLIGNGKAFSKDLQLTTLAVAFENEKNDEFIKTEIEKVVSKII